MSASPSPSPAASPSAEAIRPVRVRFAPSPTGYLHVGSARSAIFNWLFAKAMGGTFILRIEDTDQVRSTEASLLSLLADLKWLGLHWDEGPEAGGPYGPYVQSQRMDLYRRFAFELVEKGQAYPCFCTSERLDELRAQQELNKMPTGYDRRCRNIPPEAAKARMAGGEKHTIRFKAPYSGVTRFEDYIRGPIEYQNRVLQDLVLLKSDGLALYHLANVVDDHHMHISHVLRGDEWLPSTPLHVLLYQAFGWQPPVFVHLPVILSPDGGKLSKRKGAASVGDYRDLGYLPEAMVNFLSLLGWNPGEDQEFMEIPVLTQKFSIDRINPKSAAFDEKKLEWLNGQYFLVREVEYFLPLVKPLFEKAGIDPMAEGEGYLREALRLLKDRSKRLVEFVEYGSYFFRDPDQYDEKAARKHFTPAAADLLAQLREEVSASDFTAPDLEARYRALAEKLGLKGGDLIHPTRLALSGLSFGPGLFELMAALGRERVLRRLEMAEDRIRKNQVETRAQP